MGRAPRHDSATRPGELHPVHGADDVVNRIEQRWVLSKDPVDEGTAPCLDELLWLHATTYPCGADSTNGRIDDRVTALDSHGGDRCWIESAGGERIGNHRVSIVKRLLCDSRMVHARPSRCRRHELTEWSGAHWGCPGARGAGNNRPRRRRVESGGRRVHVSGPPNDVLR